MAQQSSRQRRVGERLRAIIAEEVAELKDPRLGFVTVTGVEMSADLKTAHVFYSVLGDDRQATETAAALVSAMPRVRSRVGGRVRMRYVPEISFEVDESVERGRRIAALFAELEEDE